MNAFNQRWQNQTAMLSMYDRLVEKSRLRVASCLHAATKPRVLRTQPNRFARRSVQGVIMFYLSIGKAIEVEASRANARNHALPPDSAAPCRSRRFRIARLLRRKARSTAKRCRFMRKVRNLAVNGPANRGIASGWPIMPAVPLNEKRPRDISSRGRGFVFPVGRSGGGGGEISGPGHSGDACAIHRNQLRRSPEPPSRCWPVQARGCNADSRPRSRSH